MPQVFLSYRTDDEPFAAAFFDDKLALEFGPDAVFFASRSIDLGADWEKAMFKAVSDSDAVLVIIGPRWLTATGEDGRRRLDDPQDFVRREVELGFQLDKQVIPVHLERRHRLDDETLPESVRRLAKAQSALVAFRNSKPDIARLVTYLGRQIPSLGAASGSERRPGGSVTNIDNSSHNSAGHVSGGTVIQAGKQIGGIFISGGGQGSAT